jgi:hypothetical protein
MNITWNKVTKTSQITALVLFVGVFALGFWLGMTYEYHAFMNGIDAYMAPAPTEIVR